MPDRVVAPSARLEDTEELFLKEPVIPRSCSDAQAARDIRPRVGETEHDGVFHDEKLSQGRCVVPLVLQREAVDQGSGAADHLMERWEVEMADVERHDASIVRGSEVLPQEPVVGSEDLGRERVGVDEDRAGWVDVDEQRDSAAVVLRGEEGGEGGEGRRLVRGVRVKRVEGYESVYVRDMVRMGLVRIVGLLSIRSGEAERQRRLERPLEGGERVDLRGLVSDLQSERNHHIRRRGHRSTRAGQSSRRPVPCASRALRRLPPGAPRRARRSPL